MRRAVVGTLGGLSNRLPPVQIPLGPHNDYRLKPDEIRKHINLRTKMIVICDPINPFGTIQSKQELIDIVNMARELDIITARQAVGDAEDQLKRTFQTNIFGMFYLTQAAMPHLRTGSAIINCTESPFHALFAVFS